MSHTPANMPHHHVRSHVRSATHIRAQGRMHACMMPNAPNHSAIKSLPWLALCSDSTCPSSTFTLLVRGTICLPRPFRAVGGGKRVCGDKWGCRAPTARHSSAMADGTVPQRLLELPLTRVVLDSVFGPEACNVRACRVPGEPGCDGVQSGERAGPEELAAVLWQHWRSRPRADVPLCCVRRPPALRSLCLCTRPAAPLGTAQECAARQCTTCWPAARRCSCRWCVLPPPGAW